MKEPPNPTPKFDSRKFCGCLDVLGRTNDQKFIKLVHILYLYGKLDEVADLIQGYYQWTYEREELLEPTENLMAKTDQEIDIREYLISNNNPENEVTIT